jgi:hypothetical protein
LVDKSHLFYKKFNLRLKKKLKKFLKKGNKRAIKSRKRAIPIESEKKKSKQLIMLIFDLNKKFCDQVELKYKDLLNLSSFSYFDMKLAIFGGLNHNLKCKRSLLVLNLFTLKIEKNIIKNAEEESCDIARFGSITKFFGNKIVCGGGFTFESEIFDFLKGISRFDSRYQELLKILQNSSVKDDSFGFWQFANEFIHMYRSVFVYNLKKKHLQTFDFPKHLRYSTMLNIKFEKCGEINKINVELVDIYLENMKQINIGMIFQEYLKIFKDEKSCFLTSKEDGKRIQIIC